MAVWYYCNLSFFLVVLRNSVGNYFFGSVVQWREGLSDVPVPQGEGVELLLLGVRLVLVVLLVLAQVCQWR